MTGNYRWDVITDNILNTSKVINDILDTTTEKDVDWAIRNPDGTLSVKTIPNLAKIANTGGIMVLRGKDGETLEVKRLYIYNTQNSTYDVSLPAKPNDLDIVYLADGASNAQNNRVKVNGNGKKINDATSDLICDVNGFYVGLVFIADNDSWYLFNAEPEQ